MKNTTYRLVAALALFPLISTATIVTTAADEDNGSLGGGSGISLREAVKYSGSGSGITFSVSLSGQSIRLTGGSLMIDKSLTIDASALPAGLTLSADRTGNGKTSDDTYAILLTGGNLILDSLILTGANCGESSGCITIKPSGAFVLTLDHCTLTGNAGYHASVLYCTDSPARPTDAITIRNSTITANSVFKGPAVLDVFYCNLTIQNSTFSQNQAGAISFRSGGPSSAFSISNSTIIGNPANFGAGGLFLDLEYNRPPSTVYIHNTICTGNTPANISISPDLTVSGTNNLLTGNPLLAPLGEYGGPTRTMPPLPGSPAINAGTTTLTTDQRGFPRVDTPDIGAVEYYTPADFVHTWKSDSDGDGLPFGAELALGTNPGGADVGNSRNLTAPVFDPSGHAVLRFGIGIAAPGTRWILKRSPGLSPGGFTEIISL
ncbi:MAG: choice-of-anchor Q domain-containing protein [Luteolibacter sp.]